eukprot:11100126-Ditylum_brightwellii.AAC.1
MYRLNGTLQESRTDIVVSKSTDDGTERTFPPTEKSFTQSLAIIPLHQNEFSVPSFNNRILLSQGNMLRCCRTSPDSSTETNTSDGVGRRHTSIETLSDTSLKCFSPRLNDWEFCLFDKIWRPDQHQEEVLQDIEPLAASVVDGSNACIFSYEQ